jgi:hypothetical protein
MRSLRLAFGGAALAACLSEFGRDPAGVSQVLVLAGCRVALDAYTLLTGAPCRDWHGTLLWVLHVVWQACVCLGVLPMPAVLVRLVRRGIYLAGLVCLHTTNQVRPPVGMFRLLSEKHEDTVTAVCQWACTAC